MRTGTVSYRLEDLKNGVIIPIGFVGENDFTKVFFDAEEIYKKYPSASVSMKVQPPKGGIYPATVTRDGNTVIWQVKEADVANRGGGELQLTFIDGETKIKTYIAKTDVKRSLAGNGPAPDPVQGWVDNAEEVLDDLEAMDTIAKNAQAGDIGKALSPKTVEDGVVTEWQYIETGGGTEDYSDLENKPSIGGVTLAGDKSLHDLGIAAESAIPDVSGKANLSVVAPAFDQATANDAGSLVTYTDGVVYVLQKGHTAGTTWANTQKTATNIAEQQRLLKNDIDGLEDNLGDDWNETTQTITPSSDATAGYAYFSPVEVGSSINLSTNSGHSYFKYNNLTPGKTYHFKTYANSTWNNNHIVFADSNNKVTGFAIGQQSSAGSVEADVMVPAGTVLTYVICNKGTSDTSASIAVTIYGLVPLTTDVKNIREDVEDIDGILQGMKTAVPSDEGKVLTAKTIENGEVTEWEFKEIGSGGSTTEERYESVTPVSNSAANGRTNATVGSTISFGSQTDWYHVKFTAEQGKYRATYFSSNSTKYNNIVAVDSSEKVLEILNDTPSGAGVITKEFTAPVNTTAIYLCCYGDIGRVSTALMLEKAVDMTEAERLDNVEKQTTSASANLTKSAVAAYMTNVTYPDGDYSSSAVNGYINNPKKIYREDVPNPVVIRWNPIDNAVSITVTINKTNSPYYGRDISYEADPTASSLDIYNLVPNTTYYYQVTAILSNGTSAVLSKGTVTTADSIVRMLKVDGLVNVRDIGGKQVTGGKVKYGLIYRGSELDGIGFSSSEELGAATGASIITDNGRLELLNNVGVRAELDLRAGTYTKSAISPALDFACVGFPFYENVLVGDGLTALKTAFDFIVNEVSRNRPVYVHCSGGNDRTGTIITCMLGLLGVSENDLSKEYELSSFTFGQSRARDSSSYNYKGLMTGVLALTGTTLADKFETLFTSAGVTSANITAFRSAMIEP